MKLDRRQVANMLGVKLDGLKTIERRKQIEKRLKDIGYNLINKITENRKAYYIVEMVYSDKQLINSICRHSFNTLKTNEFTTYFKERTKHSKKDKAISLESLAEISNVNSSTICKWDLKLLDKKIISKDGFFYFKLNKLTQTVEEVTKEEFKSFWKNRGRLKTYNNLQRRYLKGEITFNEALEISNNQTALRLELENKYLYRAKRYKLNLDNKLYIDFSKLIKGEFTIED
ncbi:MAG: hypothetical protein LIR50_05560 [Bacillota bacterium]|nr:hypothetical protein [Bacillota bacterium]